MSTEHFHTKLLQKNVQQCYRFGTSAIFEVSGKIFLISLDHSFISLPSDRPQSKSQKDSSTTTQNGKVQHDPPHTLYSPNARLYCQVESWLHQSALHKSLLPLS